jgi:shikimate dehydrogenase
MLDHQVPLTLDWFGIDAKDLDIVALARSVGR